MTCRIDYGLTGLGGERLVRTGGFPRQGSWVRSRSRSAAFSATSSRTSFRTGRCGVTVSYPLGTSAADANLERFRLERSRSEASRRSLELPHRHRGQGRGPERAHQPAAGGGHPGLARARGTPPRSGTTQVRGGPVDQLPGVPGPADSRRRATPNSRPFSTTSGRWWTSTRSRRFPWAGWPRKPGTTGRTGWAAIPAPQKFRAGETSHATARFARRRLPGPGLRRRPADHAPMPPRGETASGSRGGADVQPPTGGPAGPRRRVRRGGTPPRNGHRSSRCGRPNPQASIIPRWHNEKS